MAEANRRFYAKIADLYDRTESCVTDPEAQSELQAELDSHLTRLGKPVHEITALDACGGSGNVTLKLLSRGINVTVADISSELLAILQRKAHAAGTPSQPSIHCGEIAHFLDQTDRTFDLVVFSSALHHLQDIEGVLTRVYHRLRPGGLLFTLHDPTARARQGIITPLLLRGEYFLFKLFKQPGDVPAAAWRKLRRLLGGRDASRVLADENLGVLAEFHVRNGIDDIALVQRLCKVGFEIVRHDRLHGARFALTRALVTRLGQPTGFKLLLRKPSTST